MTTVYVLHSSKIYYYAVHYIHRDVDTLLSLALNVFNDWEDEQKLAIVKVNIDDTDSFDYGNDVAEYIIHRDGTVVHTKGVEGKGIDH